MSIDYKHDNFEFSTINIPLLKINSSDPKFDRYDFIDTNEWVKIGSDNIKKKKLKKISGGSNYIGRHHVNIYVAIDHELLYGEY